MSLENFFPDAAVTREVECCFFITYMNLTLNETAGIELNRLFEIYKLTGVDPKASYMEIRAAAKQAEEMLSPEERQFLQDGNFRLTMSFFDVSDNDSNSRYELFAGFNNFIKTLYGIITQRESHHNGVKTIVRKRLPDLVSMIPTGNNDLDITYQPANYSLIFG